MKTEKQIKARQEYINLILSAKRKNLVKSSGDGLEYHHIFPRSLFPNWSRKKSNIVLLNKREHSLAHKLLYIIYPCKEMAYAVHILKAFEFMSDEELKEYNERMHFLRTNNNFKGNTIWKGRHHSLETIQKLKNNYYNMSGYHHTDECKKRISEHMKDKKNFLGKHHTKESKEKISKNSWMHTTEAKKLFSERNKGRTWWTDGTNRKFCIDCPGEGWYKGMPRSSVDKRRKTMEEKHGWKQKKEIK